MQVTKTNKFFFLFVLFLLCMQKGYAQKDTVLKLKNEFGVDIIGTIRFFKFSSELDVYAYTPTYFLTYRRYFDRGNIRFGIGGGLTKQEIPSPLGDSVVYKDNMRSVDSRIGWEFKSQLSKRWQVFYGVDLKFSFANRRNEAAYFNSGYAYGFDSHSVTFGIAPLLGFRFKLTDRISLITEANFSVYFTKNYKGRNFYTIYLPGYPELPDQRIPDTKGIYTQFNQPITTYFVFSI